MTTSSLEGTTDEDLVRSFVADKDIDALEELLRRHESRVYGLALRMLGNRSDALDATQEVMLAVFRQASSFQHRARFTTWLYRLTANCCIDLARKRARAPVAHEVADSPSPNDTEGQVAAKLDIERALLSLPEDQRLVVLMRDMQGLSYDEIAEAIASPVGTVKSRIARGRMQLAKLMEQTGDEGRLSGQGT